MLTTADIRDYLKTLGAVEATWSIGRYEAEREKRVCVYQNNDMTESGVAIGGRVETRTLSKRVSILVHWNKNQKETEAAAWALYDALRFNPRPTIAGHTVGYIELESPEPIDLGSDANGIFEKAIWATFYFEEE